jgi:hypothetical protein
MKMKILLHFACTWLVADLIWTLLPATVGTDPYWMLKIPRLIAAAAAALAGIGKELWDKYHDDEGVDPGDLTVDFTAAIIWLILPAIQEILPWAIEPTG